MSNNNDNSVVNEIDLVIPILPNMEIVAINTATSIGEFMSLDQDRIDEIKIALIEAIINAFEHSKSRDRKVHIKFFVSEEDLTVVVRDHGGGFSLDEVKKPEISEKLRSSYKRGWGLMLIENLMDDVQIQSNQEGTTLVMSKNRK